MNGLHERTIAGGRRLVMGSALRVISNIPTFRSELGENVRNERLDTSAGLLRGALRILAAAAKSYRADVALIEEDGSLALAWSLTTLLLPWNRCRFVFADPVLMPADSWGQRLLARVKGRLLARADAVIAYQKDCSGYIREYGIPKEKFRYVPFKVNSAEILGEIAVSEGDYVFAGGITQRDWPTLARATRELDIPVVVSVPDTRRQHAGDRRVCIPDPTQFGPNAKFLRHGPEPREWLEMAAGSKFVVIPILRRSLNPAGISTYLSTMALGKALIVSDGPSSKGLLDDKTAVIVPPGNPAALRGAIVQLYGDDERRRALADAGRRYAWAFGGTSRLHRDYLEILFQVCGIALPKRMALSRG